MLPLLEMLPEGFTYRPGFASEAEEATLLERFSRIEFSNFEMRGVIARRRVAFFGRSYRKAAAESELPIPDFLEPFRVRFAAWAGIPTEAFAMALINEYRPGAPIGWHRDAPQYEIVVGLSLGSPAQMRFRAYVPPRVSANMLVDRPRRAVHQLTLESRSAYLMTGDARQRFEHSIPAVTSLRYSVTFRTLRASHVDEAG